MGGKRFLVSSSRAQPRDLFRLPFAVFLRKSICMKHVIPSHMKHTVFPVPRFPHNFCLTANEKDFSLPLEMTMQERLHSPSFLWKEVAQRGRLASLSFAVGQPPALRASPFHGKGVDGLLILFLPPSSERRWRVAPEVGFALFRRRPTPCPSGIPLPWEGGWYEMIGISTLSHCQSKSGPPHRSPPILPASIS